MGGKAGTAKHVPLVYTYKYCAFSYNNERNLRRCGILCLLRYMGIDLLQQYLSVHIYIYIAQSTGRPAQDGSIFNFSPCTVFVLHRQALAYSGCFLYKAHARGAQICNPLHVAYTMTLGCSERRVPVPGRWPVGCSETNGEYVKNSVSWKLTHRAGPLG